MTGIMASTQALLATGARLYKMILDVWNICID
jgi:hypothetical protein